MRLPRPAPRLGLRPDLRSTTATASSAPAWSNVPLADNLSNAYLEVYVPETRAPARGRHASCSRPRGRRAGLATGATVLVAEAVAPPDGTGAGRAVRRGARLRGGQPGGRQGPRPARSAPHGWDGARRRRSPTGSVTTGSSSGATARPRSTSRTSAAALNRFIGDDPDRRPRDGRPGVHTRAAAPQRGSATSTSARPACVGAALAPRRHPGRLHGPVRRRARVAAAGPRRHHHGAARAPRPRARPRRSSWPPTARWSRRSPSARIVATGNADVNAHMNAVNDGWAIATPVETASVVEAARSVRGP